MSDAAAASVPSTFLGHLLACAFYGLWGAAILAAPFYANLEGVARVPFYLGGGLILYVTLVSLIIRFAEHGAGSAAWDRNGVITVGTLWSVGLLLLGAPAYFGMTAGWRNGFQVAALVVMVVGLAGSTYEMKKRERAGAWWFRLPGLTLLLVAFLLHIGKTRIGMAPFLETVASLVVMACFATGISCLLAVLPRRDPALEEGISVVVYRGLTSMGLVGLLGVLAVLLA